MDYAYELRFEDGFDAFRVEVGEGDRGEDAARSEGGSARHWSDKLRRTRSCGVGAMRRDSVCRLRRDEPTRSIVVCRDARRRIVTWHAPCDTRHR